MRLDPINARARGVEFTLTRGSAADELLWWLSYGWSEVEDVTAQGNVKRSWDQTHTVIAGPSWRWGSWDLSVAGEAHTGWPKTMLFGKPRTGPGGTGDLVVEVSDRNAFRYSVFHSLDARISKNFDVSLGDLTVFLDVANLYDRTNPCCTEYALSADGSLNSKETHWLPLLPSLGVVWRF